MVFIVIQQDALVHAREFNSTWPPKGIEDRRPGAGCGFRRRRSFCQNEPRCRPGSLAHLSKIERSHVGKIERGEHMPTISAVLKIARALGITGAELLAAAEALLPAEYLSAG